MCFYPFPLEHNGILKGADMTSLSMNTSACGVSFATLAERDAFARRARGAGLRVVWTDQMHCTLRESAVGNVLHLLAQDGPVVLEVVVAFVDEPAAGSDDSSQLEQETQLRLW